MTTPRGFIFDLNGTMIDDMEYHIRAWSAILNDELNAGLSRQEVKEQMYGKNSELLERVFGSGRFTPREVEALSQEKERRYQEAFRPHLCLISGLPALLEKAAGKGIPMAVGSAAIPFNIDFVLDNLSIRHYFSAIVSATDVKSSKPDPETYLKAAALLGLAPADCLVFEDAPKGVEAAVNAGMSSVVLTTMHDAGDFKSYPGIRAFIADYEDARVADFLA